MIVDLHARQDATSNNSWGSGEMENATCHEVVPESGGLGLRKHPLHLFFFSPRLSSILADWGKAGMGALEV